MSIIDPRDKNITKEQITNLKAQVDLDNYNKNYVDFMSPAWIPATKSISEWQTEIHKLAVEKGWYKSPKSDTESLALAMCEIAEAIEEVRKGVPSYYEKNGKPEGIQVEVADCIIRLLDLCEFRGWNIEEIIQKKHSYNATRPEMHGKKL